MLHPRREDLPEPDLAALSAALEESLERARPDVVLYQGGVDVLAEDHLGRLSLSREGVLERDRVALGRFRGENLPVALTLGGGYAKPIEASVAAYAGTYRVAAELSAR